MLALFAVVAAAARESARAEVLEHLAIPVNFVANVPCAVGGAGEAVAFSGVLHIRTSQVIDGRGGVHASTHFQPQGILGIGLSSGDVYRSTGVTRETFHVNGEVVVYTLVNNFRLIGAGPGNNFLVHEVLHLVRKDDGGFEVESASSGVRCR